MTTFVLVHGAWHGGWGSRRVAELLERRGHKVAEWEADSGQFLRSMTGHSGSVRALGFSPDGHHLASGSDDKSVGVWAACYRRRSYWSHASVKSAVTAPWQFRRRG